MDKKELEFRVNQIVYEKVFDEEDCKKLESYYINMIPALSLSLDIKESQTKNIKDIIKNNVLSDYRKSLNKTLYGEEYSWIKKKISPFIKEINDTYFQFSDLSFEEFDIIEYKENDEFKWHPDVGLIKPYSLRRISIVIFISDRKEYEGGQLEFMPKLKEPLKMEKGYMVAFPSHKIHRVAPIISGTRRTLVNWLYEHRT